VWIAGGAILLAIAILAGLSIAAAVFHWQGYWKSAAQPYATVLTGLAVLAAAALALYNGERQRSDERQRWTADQVDRRLEADRLHDREIKRELRSRFTTATEQLADQSPTIRRSGAYAVAALADDWYNLGNLSEVRVCLDVLTAYLREPNADFDEETHLAGPDGSVRSTIVTLLAQRRSAKDWKDRELSLRGSDLREVDFSGTSLAGVDLRQVDLKFAHLVGCDLAEANLGGTDLTHADMSYCNLTAAYLLAAQLSGADLTQATLIGARLHLTIFINAKLVGCDLSKARGSAFFADTDLSYSKLCETNLADSRFSRTELKGVDVAEANLSRVTFTDTSVASLSNIHRATLSERQRAAYADAIAKSQERSQHRDVG
jgi:uncharacterized protein YjbI with pentapeptide repeats